MANVYQLTDEFVKEWNRVRRKVDGLKIVGMGGSNNADGITVGPPLSPKNQGGEDSRRVFPVTLSGASGSAGTNSPPAAATYTYTVTDAFTGVQIGTSISVWMARQPGHVTAASKGLACWISGTLYIVLCDEVIDTTTC